MTDDPTQLVRTIADGHAAPAVLDRLIAGGAASLPAIVDGLTAETDVPTLTTALAALALPDVVAVFGPMLRHDAPAVRRAAAAALGTSGDVAAVPLLAGRLRALPAAVTDALADLGHPDAIAPLTAYVVAATPADPPGAAWAADGVVSRVLGALDAVAALARLGDHAHAAFAFAALEVRDDAAIRVGAARALWYVTAPGTAAALRRAARDPVREVAEHALQGMLLLGRATEAEAWISMIADDDPHAGLARWCLAAWAGPLLPDAEALVDAASARAWWHQTQPFLVADRCYRKGQLADPGALIDELAAPASGFLRAELRARTGCPAVRERLAGDPASPGELAAVRAWWTANAARFPAGQLHRWGRSVTPTAVD